MPTPRVEVRGRAVEAGFPEMEADALAAAAVDGDSEFCRAFAMRKGLYIDQSAVSPQRIATVALKLLRKRGGTHPGDASSVLCVSEEAAKLSMTLDALLHGYEPLGIVEVAVSPGRKGYVATVSMVPWLIAQGAPVTDPEEDDQAAPAWQR